VGSITSEQKRLLEFLYDVNGQDAYDAEAAALGRLKQEEYLALPTSMDLPTVRPVDVGRSHVREKFKVKHLAAVYKLNKERAPAGENAVIYGLLRMEAVKMGWYDGQKETIKVPFNDWSDAMTTLTTDLGSQDVRSRLEQIRTGAFLIPLVAEHTFRTYGHHYLSGQAAEYQQRYKDTLRACLREDVCSLLAAPNLYHHVLHWVSPARAYNVLAAQLQTHTLPDAIVIRANATPAGTAIITTTNAVLDALESADMYTEVDENFSGDLDGIRAATRAIQQDVRKWHKAYYAYGVAGPSAEEIAALEDARKAAIAFAPYAQGFIEGTLSRAALGRARALKKYADLNPLAYQRSVRFFRAVGRKAALSVEELFATSVDRSEAQG